MPIDPDLLPREDEKDEDLAQAYLDFIHAKSKTPKWDALFWTWDRMRYLSHHLPHRAWRVILLIWSEHQCPNSVSHISSELQTLILHHFSQMFPIIEAEAYRDPAFAKILLEIEQITLTDEVYSRLLAAGEQRAWDGPAVANPADTELIPAIEKRLLPQEDEGEEDLARAWITLQTLERDSESHRAAFWAHKRERYLIRWLPQKAWRVILIVWSMDQSPKTVQNLSAGPIEDLLVKHGGEMIPLVEAEAKGDPTFARLLGGVWKNQMTDEVWERVQKAWDRRGWDGIPE
jgi:hypothetical protein